MACARRAESLAPSRRCTRKRAVSSASAAAASAATHSKASADGCKRLVGKRVFVASQLTVVCKGFSVVALISPATLPQACGPTRANNQIPGSGARTCGARPWSRNANGDCRAAMPAKKRVTLRRLAGCPFAHENHASASYCHLAGGHPTLRAR